MAYLGEDITKLGFGLMRLPRIQGTEDIDIEQTKQMVDAFMEAGGMYFDTARAYGESEAVTKRALVDRYPRESFYLATKNAAWSGAKTADEAKAYFDTSLEQTGARYFDFYLIHNTGDARTNVFDAFGMWDFVKDLKAQGKVRHIGFSHHGNARQLDQLLCAHPEMEFVQLQINYADWNNPVVQSRCCMEVCLKHGKPIVIMEPVRGGTLANPPKPVAEILHEANPEASYVSWALRFALGVPNIITVLSGMSSLEQMQQNLATLKGYEPLTDDEMAVLKRAQEKLDEIMEVRCTACKYCMKDCPQHINIPDAMDSLNQRALYGLDKGRGHYGWSMKGFGLASECIQCGQCEGACPQHIDIIHQLERAAEYFE